MTGRKAHTWMDGVNACLDVTGKNPKDDKPGKNPKDDKPGKKPKDDKPGKNPKDDKPGKNPKGDQRTGSVCRCGPFKDPSKPLSCCGINGDWEGQCGSVADAMTGR